MYEIGGRRIAPDQTGFGEALAVAHERRWRPRCLCTRDGVEMYVARLANGHVVKRMPGTGSNHHPECASYEPPWELSGRGEVMGKAIVEDPRDGTVTLRLDFALTRQPGRSAQPAPGDGEANVKTDGTRLTLKGLLHYLWDEAGLTHWHRRFEGVRTWAVVRKRLLEAAEGKITRGKPLAEQLYVPESFSIDRREEINDRRLRRLTQFAGVPDPRVAQPLMLLIGEVKEIAPARFGHRAVIKHLPDQPLAMDATLFRRMERRYASDLALWAAKEEVRMMVLAVCQVQGGAVPSMTALALMPVNRRWIPVVDMFDCDLVKELIESGRPFRKCLTYSCTVDGRLPSALLMDQVERPVALFITKPALGLRLTDAKAEMADPDAWVWTPGEGPMPDLPKAKCPDEVS